MIRDVPIRGRRLGRIGQSGEIVSATVVSAVDADTGEALDPGSFDMYYGPGGAGSSPDAIDAAGSTPSAPALFTSPSAFTSGTGLGPINLPSPLPSPSLNTSWIIWVVLIAAAIFLISEATSKGGRRR